MAKISVKNLADKMGIPDQDLIFKLKSIGVRVDEENADIDAATLQAILSGKKLSHPREVILRDEESKATAPPPTAAARRRLGHRMPPNPLRPNRRRTMIQKVEPRIKTIPVSEAPAAATPEAPAKAPNTAAAPPTPAAGSTVAPQSAPKPPPASPPKTAPVEVAVDEQSGRSQRRAERKKQGGDAEVIFKDGPPKESVTLTEGMTVREFAEKMGLKAKDLIKLLLDRGQLATINHVLEVDAAEEIAIELGVETVAVSFEEEVQLQQVRESASKEGSTPRPPVVTIMGHVDHGKTTLLDTIRESKITEGEFGGITQHIGAYQVEFRGEPITFLDTPGHEAFTLMRARGASVTDVVILVVAADDGVMPQTIEAIDHARAAEAPIIVAINKIDKGNANPDRVKKDLSEHELLVEDWGGDTVSVPISALEKQGIDDLLEMILLTTELVEPKATPELPAQGVIIEARKEVGRGIVATVLVQDGTLRIGDVFVAGAAWGRVRSLSDDLGQRIEEASPSFPVEVTGFNDLPSPGDLVQVVEAESKARSIAEFRKEETRQKELAPSAGKVSLESLFESIQEGEAKELRVVLKADVQGSLEVLNDALTRLSTDKVQVKPIHSGVGAISTNDVLLASASEAIVVGFNVRPERNASELAEKESVDIRLHTVIYEVAEEITNAMTGLLEPTFREVSKGRAEVREVFKLPKVGRIAGCHVVEGLIPRSASARLLRDNVVVFEGQIGSLRRFKEDATEVRSGFDCGIRLENFQDVKPGDIIEAFVQEEVAATL